MSCDCIMLSWLLLEWCLQQVYKMANVRKQTDILKKMEHTKEERQPDLRAMKEERDREMRRKEKKLQQEQVMWTHTSITVEPA